MNPALCHKCGLLLDGPLLSSAVICKCDGVELPPLPDAPSAAGEGLPEKAACRQCKGRGYFEDHRRERSRTRDVAVCC